MNTENIEIKTEHPAGEAGSTARGPGRLAIVAITFVVLGAGLVLGITPRLRAQTHLAAETSQSREQTVAVTSVTARKQALELSLPADIHAYEQTRIYARADGYLRKWNADIGARVEAGQVLAEIDTPELDQELNQARAALAQAQANLVLARTTAERWQGLLADHAVSHQEVDEKNGALAARQADAQAAEAAVRRLVELTSFKEVRAPFAGTVTRRLVDTGALIRAGAAASALFELAQTDTLRVQVNVPQAYLRDIALGASAQVKVPEYPGRSFAGKVLRTSGAVEPASRTMLTEIEVPNHDGALFPGTHAEVQLSLASSQPPMVVPATAVLIRGDGVQVAVVDSDSIIRLQKVQLGRDLGKSVEIVAGLAEGAKIVTNPNDTLTDGMKVRIAGESGTTTKQVASR
jgi:RND family efflux transporter MFP subunit